MSKNLYAVSYGVDSRHLHEFAGVFDRLGKAQEVYDGLPMPYPFKARRLTRLEFANKFEPATRAVVVKEVVA